MLGQVLGWGLLGCPCAVEQFPLQEGQVGLSTHPHAHTHTKRETSHSLSGEVGQTLNTATWHRHLV